MGVVGALRDGGDMTPEEHHQFLEIMNTETQTCWSIAKDLHTLVQSHERCTGSWRNDGVSAAQLTKQLRTEVVPQRSVPTGLGLTLSEPAAKDRLVGYVSVWLAIATKLIDHALTHATAPGDIAFAASKGSIQISYPDPHCDRDALKSRLGRIPRRSERRHFSAELGMGLSLVSKLAEIHDLSVSTEVERDIHTIRVASVQEQ